MVTVEADADGVEARLRAGALVCPVCSGVLAGWGRARGRSVRGSEGSLWIVPRRSRCTGCGVTHVLLPVLMLVRRADVAAVIGSALAAKAAGVGHRRIAAGLGRAGGDGAGLVAPFRHAGRGGACGVHLVVPGAGTGSGAAWAGRQRLGGRPRGDHRCRGGGRGPVRARHGGVLGGRLGGVGGSVAGPGLAVERPGWVINTS